LTESTYVIQLVQDSLNYGAHHCSCCRIRYPHR